MSQTYSAVDQIIEDLKFYGEISLTVSQIEVGYSVWTDLMMRGVLLLHVPEKRATLLGIPITTCNFTNPWTINYGMAEVNK